MTEQTLKAYFEHTATAEQLATDLNNSTEREGDTITVHIEQLLDGEFEITKKHLLHLLEDILSGKLPVADLTKVSYGLIISEYFYWDTGVGDGERVAEVIYEIDSYDVEPEIPLEKIQQWKEYLAQA